MLNYQLVLTEHLNHYGYLFGGALLKWVDESAYICARLDYPGKRFVTVGMDKVSYKKRVDLGSILLFNVERERVGKTSVTYRVVVSIASPPPVNGLEIFSTLVTFVCVDKDGSKCSLQKDIPTAKGSTGSYGQNKIGQPEEQLECSEHGCSWSESSTKK